MIAHFSIPARDPQSTAELFARIIDGVAIRFPIVDGAWMALARDGSGTSVEVVPETTAIQFVGEDGAPPVYQSGLRGPPTEAIAIHFALTTHLSQDEVMAMGQAQGWRTTHQSRGPFDLVEMWIDNRIMIEVLPPPKAPPATSPSPPRKPRRPASPPPPAPERRSRKGRRSSPSRERMRGRILDIPPVPGEKP